MTGRLARWVADWATGGDYTHALDTKAAAVQTAATRPVSATWRGDPPPHQLSDLGDEALWAVGARVVRASRALRTVTMPVTPALLPATEAAALAEALAWASRWARDPCPPRERRRVDVAVNDQELAALDRMIELRGVSLTEAVRRLVLIGDYVHRTFMDRPDTTLFVRDFMGERPVVVLDDHDNPQPQGS